MLPGTSGDTAPIRSDFLTGTHNDSDPFCMLSKNGAAGEPRGQAMARKRVEKVRARKIGKIFRKMAKLLWT